LGLYRGRYGKATTAFLGAVVIRGITLRPLVWCTQLLRISLYSPPSHSKVHLKFGADLHIDLLGQSAEESTGSTVLYTHVGARGVQRLDSEIDVRALPDAKYTAIHRDILPYNRYHKRGIEPKRLHLVYIQRHCLIIVTGSWWCNH
jgi:hypothetical protein